MTNKNTEGDNWGQLLSDFGIEDQTQEEAAVPEESIKSEPDDFGTGLTDAKMEISDEPSKPKEKKSILSRFPKINNFFGVPPQVSLDSVIEGVKSPLLGGKTFTDNKLEKMPITQERRDQQEKNVAQSSEALSAVASQIDVLASGEATKAKPAERPSRRSSLSMFDDPIPESEEFRALKDLMGEQVGQEGQHKTAFLEEEPNSRHRGRGRRQSPPEDVAKREVGERGRGSRYKSPVEVDDLAEPDFEPVDEMPVDRSRERGRRGSKYDGGSRNDRERGDRKREQNVPQEEWSEVDAALQARQDEPVQRGGRYQRDERHDKRRRPERSERPAANRDVSDSEDGGIVAVHGDIPSWDDAIGDIVAGNIARHKGFSDRGSSGKGSSGGGRR